MKHYTILRLSQNPLNPQLGVFLIDGIPRFTTLEPPAVGDVVCVAEGEYVCKRVYDRKTNGGMFIPVTYLIMDTPGKSGCLFHVGNKLEHTTGCVLIAEGYRGKDYIFNSQIGFASWLKTIGNDKEFELDIRRIRT